MNERTERCRAAFLNPPTAYPSSEILLNLAYLSATLRSRGHETLVLDATAPHKRLSEAEVERRILEFKPHFIGVTLTILYVPQTYEYLARLRKLGIPIVVGGPHANCLPEEVLEHGADIVAIGEGEDTVVELAEHFLGKKRVEDIAGLCVKGPDGKPSFTPSRRLIEDLDRIPFPDYDSFPIAHYTGSSDPHSNPIFWSIFSSRGCPFNCTFCSSHNVFGRTYRTRSPQNVFSEIEHLAGKFGPSRFAFQDDEAFVDKKRIVEFCRLVAESKAPFRFSARLRIDTLDEEMLAALSKAGFRRLAFGIESFNDDTLKRIKKNNTVAAIRKGLGILERARYPAVYLNNIVGFPWETPEHLEQNLQEIAAIPRAVVFFSCVDTPIPFPKTELYDAYHEEYGFTGWWLDPERNGPSKTDPAGAFFAVFLSPLRPLFVDEPFWKHSPKMARAIERYCWQLAWGYLQRCMSFPEFLYLYAFARLSHRLWRLSPALERLLFRPVLGLARWMKLDVKANFRYRW